MRKNKRIFAMLALPIVVFVWCIGWGFYWMGQANEKSTPKPVNKTENVTFTFILSKPKIEAKELTPLRESVRKIQLRIDSLYR